MRSSPCSQRYGSGHFTVSFAQPVEERLQLVEVFHLSSFIGMYHD